MSESLDLLDQIRREADLSHVDLWLRYFALGGMRSPFEVKAFVFGALVPTAHDLELITLALNERFAELGQGQPVPYSEDADT